MGDWGTEEGLPEGADQVDARAQLAQTEVRGHIENGLVSERAGEYVIMLLENHPEETLEVLTNPDVRPEDVFGDGQA